MRCTCTLSVTQSTPIYYREVYEEVVGGERDWDNSPAIGSIDSGRGEDDRCADIGCRSWTSGQYKDGYGRCVIIWWFLANNLWTLVPLDGKASTDGIRQDLCMFFTRNRYFPRWSAFIVALHQMLNEMNKMKRLFFLSYPPFPRARLCCRWPTPRERSTLAVSPWPIDESKLRFECAT